MFFNQIKGFFVFTNSVTHVALDVEQMMQPWFVTCVVIFLL